MTELRSKHNHTHIESMPQGNNAYVHPQHRPAYNVQPQHRSSHLQPQFTVNSDLVKDAISTNNMQIALTLIPDQMAAIKNSIYMR